MNGGAAPAHPSLGRSADRAAWEACVCSRPTEEKPCSHMAVFNPRGARVAALSGPPPDAARSHVSAGQIAPGRKQSFNHGCEQSEMCCCSSQERGNNGVRFVPVVTSQFMLIMHSLCAIITAAGLLLTY